MWVVGLGADSELRSRNTEIASIDPLELPLSRTMRFRDSNLEAVQLVNPPLDFDGVLTDKTGNVLGLWSSFAYESGREIAQDNRGVPIDLVADMLDRVRTDNRCIRSKPNSACSRWPAPASWACPMSGRRSSRTRTRRNGRR